MEEGGGEGGEVTNANTDCYAGCSKKIKEQQQMKPAVQQATRSGQKRLTGDGGKLRAQLGVFPCGSHRLWRKKSSAD